MKQLLFPHKFQKPGWIIFALGSILGVFILIEEVDTNYTINNIAIISIVIGALLATCSKEKVEDEMTQHMRLNSLLIALYINYALLIISSLFVYNLDFVYVMMFNMFTILLIFMVVFRYKVSQANKGTDNEE